MRTSGSHALLDCSQGVRRSAPARHHSLQLVEIVVHPCRMVPGNACLDSKS
uniref:Uncharacterized protein n=1 Tax=Setaria italica TaxID=4555 RepID=K3YP31_SETIT